MIDFSYVMNIEPKFACMRASRYYRVWFVVVLLFCAFCDQRRVPTLHWYLLQHFHLTFNIKR